MAGAVVGAIIGYGLGSAGVFILGSTVLASTIGGAVIGHSLTTRPSQASPTYDFDELKNTRDNALPVPIIYGKNKVAGNIIYHRLSSDKKYAHVVVALGEGQISNVTDIKFNNKTASEMDVTYHRVYVGESSQEADSIVDTGEAWPHTAYIAFTVKASDKNGGNIPTVTSIVEGLRVRVWTGSAWTTQYSQNPAYCLLDFLTNSRYGVGLPLDKLDLQSFISSAQYCDELVGGEPRFRLDQVIDYNQSSLDTIQSILMTFRAFLVYSDGKLKLQVERSQVPTQVFNMNNIVADSFTYQQTSRRDSPNRIAVEHVDKTDDWKPTRTIYDNEIDQEERGTILEKSIRLYGVSRPSQAGRMARFYHDLIWRCSTTCEFRAGIDAISCEVGDVIKVSHDVPGWVEKWFRVVEIQEDQDDEMILRCIEYDASIYHDRGVAAQPRTEVALPNPFDPPAGVGNLTLIEGNRVLADGTWVPGINVSWDIPGDTFWAAGNIYLSDDGGANWQFVARVSENGYYIDQVSPGENRVRVVSENRRGVKADPGASPTATITVLGKKAPPPGVTWGTCTFTDVIVLKWNPVDIRDLQAYEIRTSNSNWGSQTGLVYRGNALTCEVKPTSRTHTFYIKAIDRSGNYSTNAAQLVVSNPAPPAPAPAEVTEFFNSIWIEWSGVSDNDLKGYNLYVAECDEDGVVIGNTEVIPYPVPDSGGLKMKATILAEGDKYYLIQVSAYDNMGEGLKSSAVVASARKIIGDDIPDGLLDESKLTQELREKIDEIPDIDLGDVEDRISDAEGRLDTVEGRVSTTESNISSLDGQIQLKASSEDLDAVEGRVSTVEGQITVQAGQIASKASQSEVDTLTGTVSDHATQITQNATAITSKASQSEVDTLTGRISTAESEVTQLGNQWGVQIVTRADGKKLASGLMLLNDPASGTSEFAVSADKLRVYAPPGLKPNDPGTPVFALDTPSGKLVLLGDLLADGTITSRMINAEAVTADKIEAEAITATKIATGAVTADKVAANAITATKIATDAVTSDKIKARAITAEKIATGAITVGPGDVTFNYAGSSSKGGAATSAATADNATKLAGVTGTTVVSNASAGASAKSSLDAAKNTARVDIDANGITARATNGDYSRLNAEQLAFYKAGSSTPHWYSKRVATGTHDHNTYYTLNWDRTPKVVCSINQLDFRSNSAEIKSWVTELSASGFRVNCTSITSFTGGATQNVNIRLSPGGEWISGGTPDGTNHVVLTIYSHHTSSMLSPSFYYRQTGASSWSSVPGMGTGASIGPGTNTYQSNILTPRSYQFRVTLSSITQADITVVSMAYTLGGTVSNTGRVTWIAVEGGA